MNTITRKLTLIAILMATSLILSRDEILVRTNGTEDFDNSIISENKSITTASLPNVQSQNNTELTDSLTIFGIAQLPNKLDELTKLYRALALEKHPDKNPNGTNNQAEFTKLSNAYSHLKGYYDSTGILKRSILLDKSTAIESNKNTFTKNIQVNNILQHIDLGTAQKYINTVVNEADNNPLKLVQTFKKEVKAILNSIFGYLPEALQTGQINPETAESLKKRFNITVTKDDLDALKKGQISENIKNGINRYREKAIKRLNVAINILENLDMLFALAPNILIQIINNNALISIPENIKYQAKKTLEDVAIIAEDHSDKIKEISQKAAQKVQKLKSKVEFIANATNTNELKERLLDQADSVQKEAEEFIKTSGLLEFIENNKNIILELLNKLSQINFESIVPHIDRPFKNAQQLSRLKW